MNSVDVEIDEHIPPSEEGETSNEVCYFHLFLLGGIVISYCWRSLFLVMLFIVRSVSGFNRCLCTNSLKESDSTVTVVAESSIHFTVQYNNYPVLHIIE